MAKEGISRYSISRHFANEPSPSDQAPPMQRAVINQLSNGIALPNRSCIVHCRRKSRKIVALVPREGIIRNHRHDEPLRPWPMTNTMTICNG
jgi:hypothetical protein